MTANGASPYAKEAVWMRGKSQQHVNEECAKRINQYWAKRGYSVNARAEFTEIPIRQECFRHRNHDGSMRVEVAKHDPPKLVMSWEIVSEPPRPLAALGRNGNVTRIKGRAG